MAAAERQSLSDQAANAARRSVTRLRRLRLASGLVMLTYVSMHLLNHMLGLVSMDAAEAVLRWAIGLWQSWPGTVLLYGAFAIHLSLALRTVHRRRNWRLPLIEWVRLWAGFGMPFLLIGHVVGTRVATSFYGFEPNYEKVVYAIMYGGGAGWQLALLAPGWLHGCLGLWISLRRYERIDRLKWPLAALMLAVPLLSAAGFINMMLIVRETLNVPPVSNPNRSGLTVWGDTIERIYIALVLAAVATGFIRRIIWPRSRRPQLD